MLVNCGLVTGTYTFDSVTPDLNPADPTAGLYAATNITFSIDGVLFFSSTNGVINVANFAIVDQYGLLATGGASNGSMADLSILLSDFTATAFSSDALPQTAAPLAPLLPGTFQLNAADSSLQLLGSIDTVSALAPGTGLLQVCKVAGSGVVVGTNFAFTVAGAPVVIPAGLAPTGTCTAPIAEPIGTVAIVETVPAGTALINVTTLPNPASLVASNLAAGSATVSVTAAGLTIATFTDALIANTAFIEVCKASGLGVAAGTPFTFSVGGTPVVVSAGACGPPIAQPAGPVAIAETLPPGVVLASVTTAPPAALVTSDFTGGTATVTATLGTTTIATFTDAASAASNASSGFYQLRYFANLQQADSYINATNAGTFDGFDPNGRICANFYVYDPREEIVSCCACLITPNGLVSLSARNDLTSNTLTGAPLTSGVTVKVLSSLPTPVGGTVCNPASPVAGIWWQA